MWPFSVFRHVFHYVSMASSDRIYRSFLSSFKFFSKGWGPVEIYERLRPVYTALISRETTQDLLAEHMHPVTTKKISVTGDRGYVKYEGAFTSPITTMLPGALPAEAETARFELILPDTWRDSSRPVYIHLAGTGDHFFWRRRRLFGIPLAKSSIASLLLENPYYGCRKPADQSRSQLYYLSDLFVMGAALIMESMLVGHWMEGEGLGPVGLTGISMGGHNASLAASLWPKPVPVVPCLSWATASSVFTDGALTSSVCWDIMEQQLFNCKIGLDERRRIIFDMILQEQQAFLPNGGPYARLKRADGEKVSVTREEAIDMMRFLMDDASHIRKFPVPLAPDLAIFLAAKEDSYIPRDNIADVRHFWPGCEVRYVAGGHVSAALFQQKQIRKALVDAMDRVLDYQTEIESVASN